MKFNVSCDVISYYCDDEIEAETAEEVKEKYLEMVDNGDIPVNDTEIENTSIAYLPDTITITWSTMDIICEAERLGVSITDKQAREILHEIKNSHDCNVGVTWELIDEFLTDKEG